MYDNPYTPNNKGQRLAQMLQVSQSAATSAPAPKQFLNTYPPRKPASPGMTTPQGGQDRGAFDYGR
jgi:hypothetical protein